MASSACIYFSTRMLPTARSHTNNYMHKREIEIGTNSLKLYLHSFFTATTKILNSLPAIVIEAQNTVDYYFISTQL